MTAIALQRRLQNVGVTLSSVDPGIVSMQNTVISYVTLDTLIDISMTAYPMDWSDN